MGQLDEAIQAHLELKRKHGASEEELQAEEQEALGPVWREPPGQQPAEPDEDAELSPELEVERGAEISEAFDEPPALEPYSYDEPVEDLPPETFHERLDRLAEPGFDEPVETGEEGPETVEFSEALEAAPPAEPMEPLDPTAPVQPEPMEPQSGDTPPRGFDAVEEPAPEEDDEGEDVLEETPDFLQETPEHDRLWFEQKPPRDFDLDE